MAQQPRNGTQRARLVNWMIQATIERGYEAPNVSSLIAAARISRPTFYDYFADRKACFLAALQEIQGRLLEQVADELSEGAPREALERAIAALVRCAEPPRASVPIIDGGAAGVRPGMSLVILSRWDAGPHRGLLRVPIPRPPTLVVDDLRRLR